MVVAAAEEEVQAEAATLVAVEVVIMTMRLVIVSLIARNHLSIRSQTRLDPHLQFQPLEPLSQAFL